MEGVRFDAIDGGQVDRVIDAGLAPLMYRAIREAGNDVPAPLRDLLMSADLTAQVRSGSLCDALDEIIDACNGV